jgi:RNA polymerase primary sigma factor
MEQDVPLDSEIVPNELDLGRARHPEFELRAEKVDRAAADLHADFQRQRGFLKQAQFDRLVLRRNLTPPEMIALVAKLAALGVEIDESGSRPSNDDGLKEQSEDAGDVGSNGKITVTASAPRTRNPYRLLSQRDEIELGRRVQLALRTQEQLDSTKVHSVEEKGIIERGRAARDRMVLANLRLVRFVVHNIRRSIKFLDSWDLFQEGVIGLMRAVEKFDPELGLRFATYALWWIRQAIFRGLDDTDRTIRLPVHRMESIRRLRYTTRRLAHELNRDPTIRELSDGLNWPMEKTLFIQRLAELECISLDSPLGEDDDRTIGDTVISREPGPFEATRDAQRADLLQRLLTQLKPREQLVIERRFGLGNSPIPETLQQVGDDLGVTRERIRQIEEKALRRLGKWVDKRMQDALL